MTYTAGERLSYRTDIKEYRPLTVLEPISETEGVPRMRVKFDHFQKPSVIYRLDRLSRVNPFDLDPLDE